MNHDRDPVYELEDLVDLDLAKVRDKLMELLRPVMPTAADWPNQPDYIVYEIIEAGLQEERTS